MRSNRGGSILAPDHAIIQRRKEEEKLSHMSGHNADFTAVKFKATWEHTSHAKMKQSQISERFQALQKEEDILLENRRKK